VSRLDAARLDAATRAAASRHDTDVPAVVSGDARNRLRRERLIAAGALATLCAGAGWLACAHLFLSHDVSTATTRTALEAVQVTTAIAGTVDAVPVTDTQPVRAGDVVVRLDDNDARMALAQAEAELDLALRRVRGYAATDTALAAHSAMQARWAESRANIGATIGSRPATAGLIAETAEDTNPEVVLARVRRDRARIVLERTVVRAPVDGVVAKRAVRVGQQVRAGATLLSVVPAGEAHSDADSRLTLSSAGH
jgi:membrane fusion protein (multidrug efflux system)